MAKIMIVPTADYKILRKYLHPSVVLIPESTLNTISPQVQAKARTLEQCEDVPYDFGDEPDIRMDVILCEESYACSELLLDKGEDEDG